MKTGDSDICLYSDHPKDSFHSNSSRINLMEEIKTPTGRLYDQVPTCCIKNVYSGTEDQASQNSIRLGATAGICKMSFLLQFTTFFESVLNAARWDECLRCPSRNEAASQELNSLRRRCCDFHSLRDDYLLDQTRSMSFPESHMTTVIDRFLKVHTHNTVICHLSRPGGLH